MTKFTGKNHPHFFSDLAEFEKKIQQLAQMMSIDFSNYEIDHLAVRVNNEQNAKNWLTLLLKYGRILSDKRCQRT